MNCADHRYEEFIVHYRAWLEAQRNWRATRCEDQKNESLLVNGEMDHVRTHSSQLEIEAVLKRLEKRLRGPH